MLKNMSIVPMVGQKKRLLIHRLVALAFLSNFNSLPEVNHVNGCKIDNNLNNLEWTSSSANISHAYQTGLRKAKLTNLDKEKILQLIEKKIYTKSNRKVVQCK